jgi:hypothetical protein
MASSRSRRRRERQQQAAVNAAITTAPPAPWDGTTVPLAALRGEPRYTSAPAAPLPPRAAPPAIEPPAPPRSRPDYQPAPPRSQPDCLIPAILRDKTIGMLCGIDLWRIHFDPEAACARRGFNALRASALAAGWRPDAFGRWACPRCKNDPHYRTPQPLAHWDPAVAHTRAPGDWPARHWLARPATEYHQDAASAWVAGDPAAEFWFAVEAEHEVLLRTADRNATARHRAGTR